MLTETPLPQRLGRAGAPTFAGLTLNGPINFAAGAADSTSGLRFAGDTFGYRNNLRAFTWEGASSFDLRIRTSSGGRNINFGVNDSGNTSSITTSGFSNSGSFVIGPTDGTGRSLALQSGAGTTAATFEGTQQDAIFAGMVLSAGSLKRVTAQFDVTSSTTLANVTGLSVSLRAATSYRFRAVLHTTSNVAGGVKAAIASSGSVTAIIYDGVTMDAGFGTALSRSTASGTAVGAATAVTAALINIAGTIVTNAAGNLTVQFAQNASNGAASSVLVGSYLEVFGF